MPTTEKTEANDASQSPLNGDIFDVLLFAPNKESLTTLLKKFPMDDGPIEIDPETKSLKAHFFVDEKQIAHLKKEGWQLEVLINLSEVGRMRQKEVGEGDRFKGGAIAPKGLGKKFK